MVVVDENGEVRDARAAGIGASPVDGQKAAEEGAFFAIRDAKNAAMISAGDDSPSCLPMTKVDFQLVKARDLTTPLNIREDSPSLEVGASAEAPSREVRSSGSTECPKLASVGPESEQETAESTAVDKNEEFKADIQKRFLAGKFAEIDEISDSLLRSHREIIPLRWQVADLHAALDELRIRDLTHDELIARLQQWIAQRPQSRTAHSVLAAVSLNALGWSRVGPETSGGVDFATRHRALLEVTRDARATSADDPLFRFQEVNADYCECVEPSGQNSDGVAAAHRYATGPHEPSGFYTIFTEAQRFDEPAANLRQIAEIAADATRGEYGDGLYAEIAGSYTFHLFNHPFDHATFNAPPSEVFKEVGMSWPRVQKGFRDLIAKYPAWKRFPQEFAILAWVAGDRAVAHDLFARPDLQWSAETDFAWRGRNNYDAAKKWSEGHDVTSFEGGRNPATSIVTVSLTFIGPDFKPAGTKDITGAFVKNRKGSGIVFVLTEGSGFDAAAIGRGEAIQKRSWNARVKPIDGGGAPILLKQMSPQNIPAQPHYFPTIEAHVDSLPGGLEPLDVASSGEVHSMHFAAALVPDHATTPARQKSINGKVASDPSGFALFHPDQPILPGDYAGTPLVNEQGHLVGIVAAMKDGDLVFEPIDKLMLGW